jgi:hypothetical protein
VPTHAFHPFLFDVSPDVVFLAHVLAISHGNTIFSISSRATNRYSRPLSEHTLRPGNQLCAACGFVTFSSDGDALIQATLQSLRNNKDMRLAKRACHSIPFARDRNAVFLKRRASRHNHAAMRRNVAYPNSVLAMQFDTRHALLSENSIYVKVNLR